MTKKPNTTKKNKRSTQMKKRVKDTIYTGDSLEVLKTLPAGSVQTCVTSPPYFGLRDYGIEGQIGLEETPEAYVQKLVEVFREVRRVLKPDGTLWLNLGDSYNAQTGRQNLANSVTSIRGGAKKAGSVAYDLKRKTGLAPKQLLGIPWRLAFALQADGWYLRQDIIWHKPNPMPESVTDRCTKAHEYIFLLSKCPSYYYDHEAVKEPAVGERWGGTHAKNTKAWKGGTSVAEREGRQMLYDKRNRRSVWTVTTKPYKGAHFATFPPDLIEPCVLAGAPEGGIVLDPFLGSGTTAAVAKKLGRHFTGIELNPAYVVLAQERLSKVQLPLAA